ncbi:LuxR C-terminal-related transcriptional regulator [Haloechinothrix halophila]|uniref:LuxR C-terminal-related transcriptional regulator n=1 Tax=Haloechinothrix halophila TaxID=1069073 RepID=UPI00041F2796|nr:LuxR C-terminal-related transcriptional regulator [Haloechinothrix halophila]
MTTDVTTTDAIAGHLRRTLRDLSQLDGLSMGLGGLVTQAGSRLVLSELYNLRCELFRGVVIRPGVGLGGVAMQHRRPVSVEDYVSSPSITHQFDRAAIADRVRSAIALPIIVRGETRAMIYGATRGEMTFGDRTVATATMIARKLSHDIEVEDEVQRRLRRVADEQPEAERGALSQSELAELNAEIIAIAAASQDAVLRDRLHALSQRVTGSAGAVGTTTRAVVHLSQRESDVITQLAAGYTNAEIAERLCILPTTVKTHLRNTMRKLGARNRVETLAAARHAGLLP